MLPIIHQGMRRQENENQKRQLILQRRVLRTHSDPFNLPNIRFIELFRLSKELVQVLIALLRPHLQEGKYANSVNTETKVLAALRFYATGSYQRAVGEEYNLGLSQTSIHRYIHIVTEAIDRNLADQFIVFPETRAQLGENREYFMQDFNFPGVVGAIDGMHVAIQKPDVEEHNYINKKGYHSMNVQIICNTNLKVLNINANYPGSTHDSFIWRQSQIKGFMDRLYENGERGYWLIGDSGYPLEPILMTPFVQPDAGTPEALYNLRHAQARNCIERCIGVLKMRFRCISKERTARYNPQFVGVLVNTCAVLHNMCIDNNIPFIEEDVGNMDEGDNIINNEPPNYFQIAGQQVRRNIVNRYFANQ